MDSRLYDQTLPNHRIFKDLRGNLKENPSGKLRNLLELKDDVMFIWNPEENCLWCLNLKLLEEKGDETPYQKLHFLSPPSFTVERVLCSPCGSRVCVWGSRGVVVAVLPARWSRAALFDGAGQTVLCKSHSLDERFLFSQGEVRRVHWHPSSLSHVLVLVSDNTIRLYNIALKSGPKLVKFISIGPKPCSMISGRTLLESLGDTAVDFTPLPDTDTLLILRGNGDVYMLDCGLDPQSGVRACLRGPLAVSPPADDNYGSESCALAALAARGAAPLLVLATASAVLHHCLLLPQTSEFGGQGDTHALYVVESVELYSPDDALHSYPVLILPCSESSYAVSHAGGIHTVTLPVLDKLADYALADEVEGEALLPALCSARSAARHAARLSPAPAPGLACSQQPPFLLALAARGDLLTRMLDPFDLEEQLYKEMQLKNPALIQEDINSILKERQKVSFTAIIQEILARDASQPIISLTHEQEPSTQESLETMLSASAVLRREYVRRQARALEALRDKLRALLERRARLAASPLPQSEAEEIKKHSSFLREQWMLAVKNQDDLKQRCSTVLRLWGDGAASGDERRLLAKLRAVQARVDALAPRLTDAARGRCEMKQWKEEYGRKSAVLGTSHSDTVASILQQQTSQISTLIEETKLLKDQLSIV